LFLLFAGNKNLKTRTHHHFLFKYNYINWVVKDLNNKL